MLTCGVRREDPGKGSKGIQIGKEVKLSLFVVDMILYMENPRDATRKLLELINIFCKDWNIKLIHSNNEKY